MLATIGWVVPGRIVVAVGAVLDVVAEVEAGRRASRHRQGDGGGRQREGYGGGRECRKRERRKLLWSGAVRRQREPEEARG